MEAPPNSRSLFSRHAALGAVVLAGSSLAVWSFQDARERDFELAKSEFVRRAVIRHALTREVLSRYEDALFGLSTLFMVEQDVSRTQFLRASRRLTERAPGALALQWVPLVTAAERPEIEAELQRSYLQPDLAFTEINPTGQRVRAGERDTYLPISYIQPLEGSEPALGYDLMTGPTHAFLETARASNRLTLTRQVRLVQVSDGRFGVIMIAPVRWMRDPDGSPENGSFEGYVQAVFLTHDLLERTSAAEPDIILDMLFVDASETDPARRVLYYRPVGGTTPRQPEPAVEEFQRGLTHELPIPIGGRDWRVIYRPHAGWMEQQFTSLPWVRTSGVLLITALLAGLVQSFGHRTERVEQEVAERTAELEAARRLLEEDVRQRTAAEQALKTSEARVQAILDHSSHSIFVKDLTGRYVLVNRQLARMWHRSIDDFVGRDDTELFTPEVAAGFRGATSGC